MSFEEITLDSVCLEIRIVVSVRPLNNDFGRTLILKSVQFWHKILSGLIRKSAIPALRCI